MVTSLAGTKMDSSFSAPFSCSPDVARLVCRDGVTFCGIQGLVRASPLVREQAEEQACRDCGGGRHFPVAVLLPDFSLADVERALGMAGDGSGDPGEAAALLALLGGRCAYCGRPARAGDACNECAEILENAPFPEPADGGGGGHDAVVSASAGLPDPVCLAPGGTSPVTMQPVRVLDKKKLPAAWRKKKLPKRFGGARGASAGGGPKYDCCLCPMALTTFPKLRDHLATCHYLPAVLECWAEGSPDCPVCGFRFVGVEETKLVHAMARHLAAAHGRLDTLLPPDVLAHYGRLQRRGGKGGGPPTRSRPSPLQEPEAEPRLRCPLCPEDSRAAFQQARAFRRHLVLIHYSRSLLGSWDGSRVCGVCKETVENVSTGLDVAGSMALHLGLVHDKLDPLLTSAVRRMLEKEEARKKKMWLQPPKPRAEVLKCPVCKKQVTRACNLREHLLAGHYLDLVLARHGGGDHKCRLCDRDFGRGGGQGGEALYALARHLAFAHGVLDEVVPDDVREALRASRR